MLFQLAGLIIGSAILPDLTSSSTAAVASSGGGNGSSGNSSTGDGSADDGFGDVVAAALDELEPRDLLLAVGTYVAAVLIRACVVTVHFPILRRLGYGLSRPDAVVAAWGGLHGSVGLALALSMDKTLRQLGEPLQGKRVLLHVAMVAVLTLTVNAPSMAPLLRWLGLTQTSVQQDNAFADLSNRVSDYAWREYYRILTSAEAVSALGIERTLRAPACVANCALRVNVWRIAPCV